MSVCADRITIECVQDIVKKIVAYSKYPPRGIRGYGPLFTHAAGATGATYAASADQNILVIAQIESREGLDNIEQICAVDGLDVAFIGRVSSI